MMIDIYDTNGKTTGKMTLPNDIFGHKVNPLLLAQAVRVYLSNQRAGAAKTKTRGMVTGSTAKIYKQKGTGKARHGARSAPVFVGGGIAHGPTGTQNYKKNMPKKMRRLALLGALNAQLTAKKILVIDGLLKLPVKTKKIVTVMDKLNLTNNKKRLNKPCLLVLPEKADNLTKAARNIGGLTITPVKNLNTYEILKTHHLILLPESIKLMQAAFTS